MYPSAGVTVTGTVTAVPFAGCCNFLSK